MNDELLKRICRVLIAGTVVFGGANLLVACDEGPFEEGPFEETGEEIDEAVDEVEDELQ